MERKGRPVRVAVSCVRCESVVKVAPSRARSFRYCSRSCAAKYTNRTRVISAETRAKLSAYAKTRTGENAANWRGGFTKDSLGYIRNNIAGVYEHRRVMEEFLGRALEPNEIVHHRDGNKENNSLENLELTNRREHIEHHRAMLVEARWK